MIDKHLTPDEILAKLDQTTRKSRTISFLLTIIAVVILAAVLILTYRSTKGLLNLQNDINQLEEKKKGLEHTNDDLETKISAAQKKAEIIPQCAAVENILAAKNESVDTDSKSNPSNTPLKTFTPAPTTTNTQIKTPPINDSPSTVYVQITDKSQESAARKLIDNLQSKDFRFPGIEYREIKISQTIVKFFREEDEARAKELVALLQNKDKNVRLVKVNYNSDKESPPLEIWFSGDAFDK